MNLSKRNICPVGVACRILVHMPPAVLDFGLSLELPVQAYKHAVVLRLDLSRLELALTFRRGRDAFSFCLCESPS
jgi:hypothetical protein